MVTSIVTAGITAPITLGKIGGMIMGGISAHNAGGDIGKGLLFGNIVGGIGGYLGGAIATGLPTASVFASGGLNFLEKGIITGLEFGAIGASGSAILAYGGGTGSTRDIWKAAGLGFGYGFAGGFLIGATNGFGTGLHGANFEDPSNPNTVLPVVLTTAQSVAASTPIPYDDLAILALAIGTAAIQGVINYIKDTKAEVGYVNNKALRYEAGKMGLGFDPKKQPPSDKRGLWIIAKMLEAIARQIKWWGE